MLVGLYRSFDAAADLWRPAGASRTEIIEGMIWVMALLKQHRVAAGTSEEMPELTTQYWHAARARVSHELELGNDVNHLDHFVQSFPGLLEKTRRLVAEGQKAMPEALMQSRKAHVDFFLNALRSPQWGGREPFDGSFRWQPYLPNFLAGLLDAHDPVQIYCPFEGSAWLSLAFAAEGHHVSAEAASSRIVNITKLLAYVADLDIDARCTDPLRNPTWSDDGRLKHFTCSIAITSFGWKAKFDQGDTRFRLPFKLHYGETLQLAHVLAQTDGQAIVVMPESFLFRTAGGEQQYKQHLIRNGILSAVISLPRDVFAPSLNIPTAIIVLQTRGKQSESVLFVDAKPVLEAKHTAKGLDWSRAVEQLCSIVEKRLTTGNSRLVPYDEIAANDFNISVDRYVLSEGRQLAARAVADEATIPLGDLAEILRPQVVSGQESGPTTEFLEVALQDIQSDGTIRKPTKTVSVGEEAYARAWRLRLQPDDVLLSVRGRIGAVGVVPSFDSERAAPWLPSQAFVLLRLRPSSPIQSPTILLRYLSSEIGQGLLRSVATGTTVAMVQMADLKKLPIIVPPIAEQREIERQHLKTCKLRADIREIETKIDEINKKSWPMNKMRLEAENEG